MRCSHTRLKSVPGEQGVGGIDCLGWGDDKVGIRFFKFLEELTVGTCECVSVVALDSIGRLREMARRRAGSRAFSRLNGCPQWRSQIWGLAVVQG